ncbi:putative myb dna-binding domain protein [Golovinomyces cichoracearum]|uniref:Putative myb dna-binding domain protein n=1 Tax=Golovinomyces cichoracearum TaxID=62708 RepID=A0A420H6M9_9PEZI|nr:putative myb dna-binding domain protein [Golovinomyces cichoracearum]
MTNSIRPIFPVHKLTTEISALLFPRLSHLSKPRKRILIHTFALLAIEITDANLDISLLIKTVDSNEFALSPSSLSTVRKPNSVSFSSSSDQLESPMHNTCPVIGLKRSIPSHPVKSPAKKQSKWSPEEDSLIIELRGKHMKWEDISKRIPRRSAISCRLHYQNYLERRSEWDEERKNKLARIYERFKPEMWAKVAEEMAVPWRAAEAMHWQLGENDMARRAGVTPFSLSSVSSDLASTSSTQKTPPNRSRSLSQAQNPTADFSAHHYSSPPNTQMYENVKKNLKSPQTRAHDHKKGTKYPRTTSRTAVKTESTPRSVPPASPSDGVALATIINPGRQLGQQLLPSVAEITTGVSPYSTSSFATSQEKEYHSFGLVLPAIRIANNVQPNQLYQPWPEVTQRHYSME